MIRIIFLSDTHLGEDFPVRKSTKPKRGQDYFDNFQKVLDFAVEEQADMVLHGGDLFFRAKIPEAIVNKVYKMIYDFSKTNIPFVIVPGNHERSRFPRSPLLNQPGIYVFNYPRKFDFDVLGVDISVSGFPYLYDNIRDNFISVISEIENDSKSSDIRFLLNHHAVEGCTCGPGNYTFRHNEDVIQKKDIPEFYDAVLCGHIHRQQVLFKKTGKKEIPIIYCGSTEKTSFAEFDETKGFYEILINEKTKKIEKYNFIKLPSRPQLNVEISGKFETSLDIENFISEELETVKEGTLVRIRVTNEKTKEVINIGNIQKTLSSKYFLQFSGVSTYQYQKKKKERLKGLFDE
jgi:exonuclease SbcD